MELRQYLSVLRSRLWLIVLATLLAGGTGFMLSSSTATYQARSTLYVGSQNVAETSDELTTDRIAALSSYILTFSKMIDSEPIALQALRDLDLDLEREGRGPGHGRRARARHPAAVHRREQRGRHHGPIAVERARRRVRGGRPGVRAVGGRQRGQRAPPPRLRVRAGPGAHRPGADRPAPHGAPGHAVRARRRGRPGLPPRLPRRVAAQRGRRRAAPRASRPRCDPGPRQRGALRRAGAATGAAGDAR